MKSEMESSGIRLIVHGGKWGVHLDAKRFPIICPKCKQYFQDLFRHKSSRYGFVGTVICPCGQSVSLTDSDNIVEYINCYTPPKTITLEFKKLFRLEMEDLAIIRRRWNYDLIARHEGKTIDLAQVVEEIGQENKFQVKPVNSEIPLPEMVKKWLALFKGKKHS